jgi:predicted nucleic acid-binding protein
VSAETYVLDACALIAFLTGEQGSDKVRAMLSDAAAERVVVYLHKVNLLEVYYDAHKAQGKDKADDVYQKLVKLPIKVVDGFTETLFKKAGEIKATNKVSLADSVAVSLAIQLGAAVVTSDHHEFDCLERAGLVSFVWIR